MEKANSVEKAMGDIARAMDSMVIEMPLSSARRSLAAALLIDTEMASKYCHQRQK